MLRRRREVASIPEGRDRALERFHEWVLSLPWVVERPYEPGAPGTRCFGVDCEPLGRRQIWLITGLSTDDVVDGVALVLPVNTAEDIEALGWGRIVAALLEHHVVVALNRTSVDRPKKLETLVLTAYGYAMS